MPNMLTQELMCALDPVAWACEVLGFDPDGWQADVLRSRSPRILLNCCRQSGKSTIASIMALHRAVFRPGSLVLLLSPSLRQSSELFKKVVMFHRELGETSKPESISSLRLELPNRSRIVSLPGKEATVRGFSGASLLIIDEAARVPDDLYYSVRPMLAVSRGRMIALSTPFGTRGWWYDAWMNGLEWERWEIPASKCPRISPEFLDEERKVLGSFWFEQEYNCKFIDSQTCAFRREDLERLFSNEIEEWDI